MEVFYGNIELDGYSFDGLYCKISASDLSRAEKSWLQYKKKMGSIYSMDPNKEPTFSKFCALFFGGDFDYGDEWQYTDFPYQIPCKFIATNKAVAERLFKFLKPLEYHNTFTQVYRYVEIEGKNVYVCSGDY